MKRTMALLLLALLSLSLLLSGCTEQEPALDPETGHGDAPFMNSFYYDTVEELCEGLTSYFTGNVLQEYEDYYGAERGGVFRSFITNLQNGSVPLYVPCYQDEEIEFPNEEGMLNIVLDPCDLFHKPMIYYMGTPSAAILYLDDNIKAQAAEKGAMWVVDQINRDGTGPDARQILPYDEMTERTIVLQDRTVKAVDCIRKNEDGTTQSTRTFFVYDDVLVRVVPQPDLPSDWMKDLSFEKLYLDE